MDARIPRTKTDGWTAAVALTGHLEHGEGGGLPMLTLLRGIRSLPARVQRLRPAGQSVRAVRRRAGEGMPCLAH